MRKVQDNDTLTVHYTGSHTNGEVFDSSVGGEPLEFTLGKGMLIPGFEKAVIDMQVGDKKKVEISAKEGYGEKSDEFIEVLNKEVLPAEITPEIGMNLMSETPEGQQIPLLITEVTEETFTVDANHPLSGQDLVFEIEVLSIK